MPADLSPAMLQAVFFVFEGCVMLKAIYMYCTPYQCLVDDDEHDCYEELFVRSGQTRVSLASL